MTQKSPDDEYCRSRQEINYVTRNYVKSPWMDAKATIYRLIFCCLLFNYTT